MNISEAYKKISNILGRPVKPRDVYIFAVILADNDIDKDRDMISDEALRQLSEMYVGKTGFVGVSTARIFDTEICTSLYKNKLGNDKRFLKAYCWINKSAENKDIIQAIRNSVTRETSLSFSVRERIYSRCGQNQFKQKCDCKYNYTIIREVTDVYEWNYMPVVKGE